MRGLTMVAAAALLVGGCSSEAPPPAEEAESGELAPGLYEASWTVDTLGSTDRSDPSTDLTQGATGTSRACVADGTIDPALFAEAEDECTASSAYVRGGRISMQIECRRPGAAGQVMQSVNGTSTADTIEAQVSTTTYLAEAGDYQMTRTVTARRVGECPPAGAEGAETNAAANASNNAS